MTISRREFLKTTGMLVATPFFKQEQFNALSRGAHSRVGLKSTQAFTSVCEMCFSRCLISPKVHNGQIIKIDGNPVSPGNGEKVCARGNAGIQLIYDPDRLKYPLKRVGPRGSGQWKRISWEEALTEIGQNLKKNLEQFGAQSIALFPHGHSATYIISLFEALDCKNVCEASFYQCRGNRDIGYSLTFGQGPGSPERIDLANSKAMLFIGSHLGENIHLAQTIDWMKGMSNGSQLIVVDPRYSTAASKAALWLPIRPGTDTALLLSWLHYLIYEKKYNTHFVEKHCIGLSQLRKHVTSYTPEWASQITDLPQKKIVEAIEILIQNMPHVAIHPGRHSTWYGIGDTQRTRAMALLTSLLGAYGVKGGLFLPTPIPMKGCKAQIDNPPFQQPKTLIREKWPFSLPGTPTHDVIRTTLTSDPYPIKSWIVWGQNILQSTPNPEYTKKAIEKLDFLAVVDVLPSSATLYADIILPEATYLERYDLVLKNEHAQSPYIALRQPIVPALFESKDPYWIAKSISEKMGFEKAFSCHTVEEVVDKSLASLNLTREELLRQGGVREFEGHPFGEEAMIFNTPSGKIELYSEQMRKLEVDPIPRYEKTPEPPKNFFRLLYGRSPVHTMGRTQNNKWLHGEVPTNTLWVHPDVANQWQLKTGDSVNLVKENGVISNLPIQVLVTPGIRKDCVYMEAMFGSPSKLLSLGFQSGTSDGALMEKKFIDPLVGTVGLRTNFVTLKKIIKE